MTALPVRSIRIGAVDWTLELDERADEDEIYGVTLADKQLIRISPALTGWKARETVIHELLHAITRTAWTPKDKAALTEEQVKLVAGLLTGIVRDNPVLMSWLTQP